MLCSATDDTPRSAFVRVLSSERRRRMMRGRRRQHLLTVCTLTVLVGFLRAGLPQLPVERPLGGRRLLHAALQDKTEILGYSLGLLSFIICRACSSSAFPSDVCHFTLAQRTRLDPPSRLLQTAVLFSSVLRPVCVPAECGSFVQLQNCLITRTPLSEASVKQQNRIVAVNFCFMREEEGQILNRKVRLNRVGSFCSSDTSLDSSVSSDLEVG
uniref:Transmembrane protein 44 n=1 Tax=Takifugu rubripes TaxID=31033 RepID=A0A674P3A4_TAKRU